MSFIDVYVSRQGCALCGRGNGGTVFKGKGG